MNQPARIESATSTELTVAQRAQVALQSGEQEKKLLELAKTSKSITAITNTDGYQQCHASRMALKRVRVDIEKIGKTAREDAQAFSKAVIAEQNRLIGLIEPEESRLESLQKEWDDAKEREKQAKLEAERKRVAAIRDRIDEIRQRPADAAGQSSEEIQLYITALVALDIGEDFAELKQEAEGAKATALVRLRSAHAKAVAFEAEQKRLAEEREQLAREREAEERRQAEQRAELERQRQEEEDRQAAQRERIAEEERQARLAREAEETRAREARKAEERRLAQERARQEVELQAERDRLAEQERVAAATRKAEEDRLAAEREATARAETERQARAQAEEQRLADERAQLERDQEALRLEREKPVPQEAPTATILPFSESMVSVESSGVSVTESLQPAPDALASDGLLVSESAEPLTASLDLKAYLLMESVCKFAKEWAAFQHPDSKLDQRKDRKLAARAREAEANLLAVVEQLP